MLMLEMVGSARPGMRIGCPLILSLVILLLASGTRTLAYNSLNVAFTPGAAGLAPVIEQLPKTVKQRN